MPKNINSTSTISTADESAETSLLLRRSQRIKSRRPLHQTPKPMKIASRSIKKKPKTPRNNATATAERFATLLGQNKRLRSIKRRRPLFKTVRPAHRRHYEECSEISVELTTDPAADCELPLGERNRSVIAAASLDQNMDENIEINTAFNTNEAAEIDELTAPISSMQMQSSNNEDAQVNATYSVVEPTAIKSEPVTRSSSICSDVMADESDNEIANSTMISFPNESLPKEYYRRHPPAFVDFSSSSEDNISVMQTPVESEAELESEDNNNNSKAFNWERCCII